MEKRSPMPDPNQLPHLIRLLDDDSEVVRETVVKELEAFGPALQEELEGMSENVTPEEREALLDVLGKHRRKCLRENWASWFTLPDEKQQLETALGLIADFQNGRNYPSKLSSLLDGLAEEYKLRPKSGDRKRPGQTPDGGLAHFLFIERRLSGAPHHDYYNPRNSNLVYAIERTRGLPITLASIYILVGYRLGLSIEGCNFPGHFLSIVHTGNSRTIVDCFNGGRVLREETLREFYSSSTLTLEDVIHMECDAEVMIARVLRNLMTAYERANDGENVKLMAELLEATYDQRTEL